MPTFTSTFEFRASGPYVDISRRQRADPGGGLPSSVINAMIKDAPLDTMQNLRDMIRNDRYRNAKLALVNGRPTGVSFGSDANDR